MKKKFNRKQIVCVVILDIIVLAELAVTMFWTHRFQDSMTPMFLKTYLPIVIPTLIIGKFCIHRLSIKEQSATAVEVNGLEQSNVI